MGTRADFYVGKGRGAEWIGSVSMDGYEWGERIENNDPDDITRATTEKAYRQAVADMLATKSHGTTPDMGWPWPWENSETTDCAYCFVDDHVEAFSWGRPWANEDAPKEEWPDFSDCEPSAMAGSERSGIILVTLRSP